MTAIPFTISAGSAIFTMCPRLISFGIHKKSDVYLKRWMLTLSLLQYFDVYDITLSFEDLFHGSTCLYHNEDLPSSGIYHTFLMNEKIQGYRKKNFAIRKIHQLLEWDGRSYPLLVHSLYINVQMEGSHSYEKSFNSIDSHIFPVIQYHIKWVYSHNLDNSTLWIGRLTRLNM